MSDAVNEQWKLVQSLYGKGARSGDQSKLKASRHFMISQYGIDPDPLRKKYVSRWQQRETDRGLLLEKKMMVERFEDLSRSIVAREYMKGEDEKFLEKIEVDSEVRMREFSRFVEEPKGSNLPLRSISEVEIVTPNPDQLLFEETRRKSFEERSEIVESQDSVVVETKTEDVKAPKQKLGVSPQVVKERQRKFGWRCVAIGILPLLVASIAFIVASK